MRPVMMAAAGVLAASLANGTMTVSAASPATFTAYASAWGQDPLFAYINASAALNQRYTGCTNIHPVSSLPLGSGWFTTVGGSCTGTA